MDNPGIKNLERKIVDFSWGDLADAWRAGNRDELTTHKDQSQFIADMKYWREHGAWQGFTLNQANQWLEKGYHVDAFDDVASFTPHVERRRIRSGEEGDLQYDAYLSGMENPFLYKKNIRSRPGLEIEAELALHSGTPAEVIEQYLVWLNRVAYTAEARGSDVAIRVAIPLANLAPYGYRGKAPKDWLIRITVKRPGEWLDQNAWSPMLSPAAFRGYVFLAIILTADLAGYTCSPSLGIPRPTGKWGCFLSDGILRVTCPNGAHLFPEEQMTRDMVQMIKDYR